MHMTAVLGTLQLSVKAGVRCRQSKPFGSLSQRNSAHQICWNYSGLVGITNPPIPETGSSPCLVYRICFTDRVLNNSWVLRSTTPSQLGIYLDLSRYL